MGCKIIFLTAFLVAMGASALVDTMASARVRAKARLREALRSADDRASDPNVIAAVEALSAYNPTEAPAKSDTLFGDWYQLNANEYPGDKGVDEAGNRLYTLGRGTFGVFEPKELPCAMGKASNPLVRRKGSDVIDYTIEIPISFKDAEGRPASGFLVNAAECEVLSDERLGVKFTSCSPRRRRSVRAGWTAPSRRRSNYKPAARPPRELAPQADDGPPRSRRDAPTVRPTR